MRRRQRDEAFAEFVAARRAGLVRVAFLLCGDWHRAEDLVQQALVKLYRAWPRVVRSGTEDAYVRRILVNTHVDDWRWRARRPETTLSSGGLDAAAPAERSDERAELWQALAQLPEGQRRVVVLRFWLDLSVEQVAADLEVSAGTVKSQCARGLARLRDLVGDPDSIHQHMGEES